MPKNYSSITTTERLAAAGIVSLLAVLGLSFWFVTDGAERLIRSAGQKRFDSGLCVFPIGIVGVSVLLGLVAKLGWQQREQSEQRRGDEWRRVAARLGWTYSPAAPPALDFYLRLLERDRGADFYPRNVRNVLTGKLNGVHAATFDHIYTRGGGRGSSQRTYCETVFLVVSEQLDLPAFRTRPQNFMSGVEAALTGFADIDFPARPQFSQKYFLQGAPPESVRRLFDNPAILDFYESRFPLVSFGSQNFLCLFRSAPGVPETVDDNEIIYWLQSLEQLSRLFGGAR